jgi:hypothetical protein
MLFFFIKTIHLADGNDVWCEEKEVHIKSEVGTLAQKEADSSLQKTNPFSLF